MFGVFLGVGRSERTLLNEPAGHLLRAKLAGVDEGGVAAGFACLSSPLLVDDLLLAPTPSGSRSSGGGGGEDSRDDGGLPPPVGGAMKRQRTDMDPNAV